MKKQPRIIHVAPSGFCNPLMKVDCNGAKCDDGCPLAEEASPKETMAWLREQLCDPGDSDLSKVKVGDWVCTLNGWEQVESITSQSDYPIRIGDNGYTYDGRYFVTHIFPSAWVTPPAYLNAPSKPKPEFKKGDRVLVWNTNVETKERRVFSHYDPKRRFPYVCFKYGADEWGSRGLLDYWACCQKWED